MNDDLTRLRGAIDRAMCIVLSLFSGRLNNDAPEEPAKQLYSRISAVWTALAMEEIFGQRNRELVAEIAASPFASLFPPALLPPPPFGDGEVEAAHQVLADTCAAVRQEVEALARGEFDPAIMIRLMVLLPMLRAFFAEVSEILPAANTAAE